MSIKHILLGRWVVEVGEWLLVGWKPRGMGGQERESMVVRRCRCCGHRHEPILSNTGVILTEPHTKFIGSVLWLVV